MALTLEGILQALAGLVQEDQRSEPTPVTDERAEDARTLRALVDKYRAEASAQGVTIEDARIGDALDYIER